MNARPLDTARRLAELEDLVEKHGNTIKTLLDQQADLARMLHAIHAALMEPQPGYKTSLLERVASVTLAVETGTSFGNRIIQVAKLIGALGVIGTALYTLSHFGEPPKGTP